MAFGLGKLAVLESKLDIYEDLSKEMLDKLERAVGTISENSNKVAVILERHENRLDEGDKANAAIIKMINDHQRYDEKLFERFSERFEQIEKKIDDLSMNSIISSKLCVPSFTTCILSTGNDAF